jgi:flagellar motor switch protein FliM
VQIIPANEVIVLISYELTVGETRGMMNLCIPFNSIERISGKLTANSWVSYSRKPATPESIQQIGNRIGEAPVELAIELAKTHIATADLIGLRVGDIIASEKDVREPLVVYVQGQPKFWASPGKYKGRKAIQIQQMFVPQQVRVDPTAHEGVKTA